MIRRGGAFEAAFLAKVSATPRLVSDIVQDLRDERWRGINIPDLRQLVRELDSAGRLFLRLREHGAGLAEYVATEAFETVVDGRGKTQAVFR